MPVILQSITPKRAFLPDPDAVKRGLRKSMIDYAKIVKSELEKYPPEIVVPRDQSGNIRKQVSARAQVLREIAAARAGQDQPAAQGRYRKYKRTGRLGRNWNVSPVSGDGTNIFVFNNVKYAVYVQGPRAHGRASGRQQRTLHFKHGWKSITDVSRETKKQFKTIVNRSLVGKAGTSKSLPLPVE
jgi:hypothetical protein